MKVLYYSYIPVPYRINFFNELGKFCDLTVIFGVRNKGFNELWMSVKNTYFNCIYLKDKGNNSSIGFTQVIKMFDSNKYNIFVVDGYSDISGMIIIEVLRIKKIPFILNSDGSFIKKGLSLSNIIKRHLIKSASFWNCSGKYTKNTLIHYGAIKNKTFTYPLTSLYEKDILDKPMSDNEKEEIKKELGITRKKVAIAVGQFIKRKGFDILISAWERCGFPDEYELLIIGEGKLKSEYEILISELNISNIKLINFLQKKELFKYYKASDIFILPTRQDIWGLVINEAMSCGLPIISTDKCIAAMELVNDFNNGFVVPVDNVEALAKILGLFLSEPDTIRQMAESSIESIQKYSLENMAKYHMELFSNVYIKGTNYSL